MQLNAPMLNAEASGNVDRRYGSAPALHIQYLQDEGMSV